MRIAFFAPLRKASAIGWTYGLRVYHALARCADVDFWAPLPLDAPPAGVRVVAFTPESYDRARLATYDAVLYNLGDNFEFHAAIYAVARRHPGIIILHDFVMHNFFRGYYLLRDGGFAAYAAALEKHYGLDGRAAAQRHLAGSPINSLDEMARFPLFEEAVAGARGVLTHSKFLLDRVRTVFPGPATDVFLTYDVPAGVHCSKADIGVPNDKTLVVSVGHVNRNRHIGVVIDAIGCNPDLRSRVRYHVVGPAHDQSYRDHLGALVARHGLQEVVRFTGYADLKTLQANLSAADIFANLRRPAIEGASATVVEQMLMGKPVLVANTGFYAELPDDTVLKISPDLPSDEVARTMRRLIDDPLLRARIGEHAFEYVRHRTTGDAWVERVVPFLNEVLRVEAAALLIDRLAAHAVLMGLAPDGFALDRLAEETCSLFMENR